MKHDDYKLVPSPPAKMNTPPAPPPSLAKHSDIGKMDIEPLPRALFHMKTRVCLKYLANNCRPRHGLNIKRISA